MTEASERGTAADDFAFAERATPCAVVIAGEIGERGRITFARFMELALTHPEHGYYSRSDLKWGREGDFETSPEVHPIFGYLWARQIAQCWEHLGSPERFDLIEIGGGSGAFSAAILDWLGARAERCYDTARVTLLDGHTRRLEEQRATLESRGHRATFALPGQWLAAEPAEQAVVISNECFDAFPVHLLERRGDELREWYVKLAPDGGFVLDLGEASSPAFAEHFARLGVMPGDGCRAEVAPGAIAAMRAIAGQVRRGYLITIDYGYEAAKLYAPWRRMGTLMAFRDHSPQPDPLAEPGRTDLTAHVDFTSLAAAAAAERFESAPTVSQAEALVALGIGKQLEAARGRAAEDLGSFASARRAVDTLLEPAGLGRIRVLVQAKGASLDGLACLREVAP